MSPNLTLEESIRKREADRQGSKKKSRIGTWLQSVRTLWLLQPFKERLGREENLRGSSHNHMPHLSLWFGDFCPEAMFEEEQEGVCEEREGEREEQWGGEERGLRKRRGGRQGQKERRSQEKKKGGWGGVPGTTVKWLRCYHGDSNEGTQDTLGGWRRRGLGRGGGRRRKSDGEGGGGGQKLRERDRKCKRPAGFLFIYLFYTQTNWLCWHICDVLTFTTPACLPVIINMYVHILYDLIKTELSVNLYRLHVHSFIICLNIFYFTSEI